jgi:hypothetical protein
MRSRLVTVFLAMLAITAFAGVASARVTNTDIYCIQDTVGSHGCISAHQNDTVYVGILHPVVVTGFDVKPTTFGFFIQDARGVSASTAPYSGVLVYTNTTNFQATIGLQLGDVVVVKGIYHEFLTSGVYETEIDQLGSQPESVAVVGHMSLPPAIQRSTVDLGPTDAATAEPWEHVLIKVGPVIQNSNTLANNEFSVYDSTRSPVDTMLVDDKLITPNPIWAPAGTHYTSITGIFSQEFGTYKLWPRSFADLVTNGYNFPQHITAGYATDVNKVRVQFEQAVDPVSATNVANYSMGNLETVMSAVVNPDSMSVTLTTSTMANGVSNSVTVQNVKTKGGANMTGPETQTFLGGITPITQVQQMKSATNDSSVVTGKRCTIRGICTGSNSPSDFGNIAYIENTGGGPFSGVAVFGSPTVISQGNDATVVGFVNEFNKKTELSTIQYVQINATAVPEPPASVITSHDIAAGDSANTVYNKASLSTAEQWEGVLVQINNATVGGQTLGFGQWFLIQGADSALADDNSSRVSYIVHDGDMMTLKGVCDWVFNVYRVQPRSVSDITNFVTSVGDRSIPTELALSRATSPMRGNARFEFSLPSAGAVSLRIFDLRGGLVATLANGAPYSAGTHAVSWSGLTDRGQKAPAGVYLYQLTTGGKTLSRRLVVAQ